MLAYAFQVLRNQGYRSLATEEFDNTAELCAAILCKGVASQIKQGLGRSYISETESMPSVRGRIEMTESIKTQALQKKQLVCSYDDFSVNSSMNQIIKSTMMLLLRYDISKERKKEIRKLLVFFVDVDETDLFNVDWHIHYNRNNQTYRMLITVCWLIVKGLLQRQDDGSVRMADFLDEQRMCHLYEKFILNYYRREHPDTNASASQIDWQLDDGMSDMLPVMQTDITLSSRDQSKVLIIDAKYYSHMTQVQYGAHTLHSGNLYQIFTYVKNKEYELRSDHHQVAGMLLYAKTDEEVAPDGVYQMSGNTITVRTLDLNQDFCNISADLDAIYSRFFAGAKQESV